MALQNRVTAFGDIIAHPARGLMMGNRGGRIHDCDQTLGTRRWASAAWIICMLKFKCRHRQIMAANSYTELFFLDEVTALAAGHRPCFECRRKAASDFAGKWGQNQGLDVRARAGDMDRLLHHQRVHLLKTRKYPRRNISALPTGAMILWQDRPAALRGEDILPWAIEGYGKPIDRPADINVEVVTPLCTVGVLKAGYQPLFYSSR